MPLAEKADEIRRLKEAFEVEASRFHDLQFHTFYITQDGPSDTRMFKHPNHAVSLWQYYGLIQTDRCVERFADDLTASDRQWGLKGSELTFFGILEGDTTDLFVRMASRAGSLFDAQEALELKSRAIAEIREREKQKSPGSKSVAVLNDNPLAIWLNFLLFHLSMIYPGRERSSRIQPDPFSLSLLALERLEVEHAVTKVDRSAVSVVDARFKVALSFPGEHRLYVSKVVNGLKSLGNDSVFYDFDYQSQLARPNLDVLLQDIYRNRSGLIVVFLCADYAKKEWCGLEWRAIRDIIKTKGDNRIMLVRFDDAAVEGLFSIDGYIDASKVSPQKLAKMIVERVSLSAQ